VVTQARFLAEHGISDLVQEGRRISAERAHIGDLAALRARSRLREGDALTDPDGLGGFTVAEWVVT
jgi:SAM-dependent MidA family methyltransferase